MGKKLKLMVLCSVVLFFTTFARADTYTMIFNTSDNQFDPGVDNQGWWSDTLSNEYITDNYATGVNPDGDKTRSFFTFDLSSLSETVISAKLELRRFNCWSTAESEILGLFDVSTDAAVLNNKNGINASIYNDIGTGVSFGEFEISIPGHPDDILSFDLNASAITDINVSKGNWFSIGGSLLSYGSPVSDGTELIFGSSQVCGPQRLVLVIPEPMTISIIGFGSLLLRGRITCEKDGVLV